MRKELFDKIETAIKEPIVGNYIFADDEFVEMCEHIRNYCCFSHNGTYSLREYIYSIEDEEIIFVAAVIACKDLTTRPSNFFGYIGDHFRPRIITSRQSIINVIDAVNMQKGVFKVSSGKYNYATICSHALAPQSSLEAFFNLCWNIYRFDMGYVYTENDSIFEVATEYLRNRFRNVSDDNDEDITVGNNVYSLRIGIKALAFSAPTIFSNFIKEVISAIDSKIDRNVAVPNDKKWKIVFNKWFETMIKEYGVERIKKEKNEGDYIATSSSSIKPRYILRDGKIYLSIPSIRITSGLNVAPNYCLVCGGKIVASGSLALVKDSHLTSRTEKIKICLPNNQFLDLNDIVLVISHQGKTIYESNDCLKRDFIVFSNGYEVSGKYCLPGNYLLYCKNPASLLRKPEIARAGLLTFSFEAIDGDAVQSKKQKIEFYNESTNKELHFYARTYKKAAYMLNDQRYDILNTDLCVDITANKSFEDVGVRYNGVNFMLKNFLEQSEIVGDMRRFHLSWLEEDGVPQEISIFSYDKKYYNYLSTFKFVKFTGMDVKYNKKIYYGNENIEFKFTTKNINKSLISEMARVISYKYNDGKILFYPPVLTWNIDDGPSHAKSLNKRVWYEDFVNNSSVLYIGESFSEVCDVFVGDSPLKRRKDSKGFLLGQTLYSIRNKLLEEVYICVDGIKYKIADVCLAPGFIFEPIEVDSNNKKIIWNPESFCFKESFKLKLKISNKQFPKSKGTLDLDENPIIYNCKENYENGEYIYEIVLVDESNPFLTNSGVVLKRGAFFFGNPIDIDLTDKTIKCVSLKLDSETYERNLSSYFTIRQISKRTQNTYYGKIDLRSNQITVRSNNVIVALQSKRTCAVYLDLPLKGLLLSNSNLFCYDRYNRLSCVEEGQKDCRSIKYFRFEVIHNV